MPSLNFKYCKVKTLPFKYNIYIETTIGLTSK